eukprot:m.7658 g.7658  ORF g.7658 m.7658 type:complete len:2009 (-) comp3982_c0_seq1:1786-7812(-)
MASQAANPATHRRRQPRAGLDGQPRQTSPSSQASWSHHRHGYRKRAKQQNAEVEEALQRAEAAVLQKLKPAGHRSDTNLLARRKSQLPRRSTIPAIQTESEFGRSDVAEAPRPKRRISREAIERFLQDRQEDAAPQAPVYEQRDVLPRIGQRQRSSIDASSDPEWQSEARSVGTDSDAVGPYPNDGRDGRVRSNTPDRADHFAMIAPESDRANSQPVEQRSTHILHGKDFRMQARIIRGAAITIQAWWRGHLARKRLMKHHAAATRIQAGYRGMAARREAEETRAAHRRAEVEREVSEAIAQQAHQPLRRADTFTFRDEDTSIGHSFGGYTHNSHSDLHNPSAYAHAQPQDPDTGNQIRGTTKPYYTDLVDAATTIQAAYRGHRVRQSLKAHQSGHLRKSSLYDSVMDAATTIQAAYRGHATRKAVYEDILTQDAAARVIQRAWRKWARRRRLLREHAEILGEGVDDEKVRNTIRDIAQRAVLIKVPEDVRPPAYGAAAFFHGVAVQSVTIHPDEKEGGFVLQVVCDTIVDALQTHLALEQLRDRKPVDTTPIVVKQPLPTPPATLPSVVAKKGKGKPRRRASLSTVVVSAIKGKKNKRANEEYEVMEKPETPIPYPPGQEPLPPTSPFRLLSHNQAMTAVATAAALRERWEARVAQINSKISHPAVSSHALVSNPDKTGPPTPQNLSTLGARSTTSSPILTVSEPIGVSGDGLVFVHSLVDVVNGFEPTFLEACKRTRVAARSDAGVIEWSVLQHVGKPSRFRLIQCFKDSASLVAHNTRTHTISFNKDVGKICTMTSTHYHDTSRVLSSVDASEELTVVVPMRADVSELCVHLMSFTTLDMYVKELTYLLMAFREDVLSTPATCINCVVLSVRATSAKNSFICALTYRSVAEYQQHASRRANLCKRADVLTTKITPSNYTNAVSSGELSSSDQLALKLADNTEVFEAIKPESVSTATDAACQMPSVSAVPQYEAETTIVKAPTKVREGQPIDPPFHPPENSENMPAENVFAGSVLVAATVPVVEVVDASSLEESSQEAMVKADDAQLGMSDQVSDDTPMQTASQNETHTTTRQNVESSENIDHSKDVDRPPNDAATQIGEVTDDTDQKPVSDLSETHNATENNVTARCDSPLVPTNIDVSEPSDQNPTVSRSEDDVDATRNPNVDSKDIEESTECSTVATETLLHCAEPGKQTIQASDADALETGGMPNDGLNSVSEECVATPIVDTAPEQSSIQSSEQSSQEHNNGTPDGEGAIHTSVKCVTPNYDHENQDAPTDASFETENTLEEINVDSTSPPTCSYFSVGHGIRCSRRPAESSEFCSAHQFPSQQHETSPSDADAPETATETVTAAPTDTPHVQNDDDSANQPLSQQHDIPFTDCDALKATTESTEAENSLFDTLSMDNRVDPCPRPRPDPTLENEKDLGELSEMIEGASEEDTPDHVQDNESGLETELVEISAQHKTESAQEVPHPQPTKTDLNLAAREAEKQAYELETQAKNAEAIAAAHAARQTGISVLRELLNRPRHMKIDPSPGWSCTFMTDVEGHWEFFKKQVDEAKVLSWRDDGMLDLAENGYFVHGGDAVDKGPGDIRVLRVLVNLKERCPDRVFLILGNRDVNKLRMWSELSPSHLGENPVIWDSRHTSYSQYLIDNNEEPAPLNALQWMLKCTMGCPETFETRRLELAELRGVHENDVDDQAVFASFREMSDPGCGLEALYIRYVCLGQFAGTIGDALFLHGALHLNGLGFVPDSIDSSQNVLDWCANMDKWHVKQVNSFLDFPDYHEDGTRSFDDLLDYVVPWAEGHKYCGRTSVYSDGFCARGSLQRTNEKVAQFVMQCGISRIFVGHAPQGDCPSVIRNECGLTVMMCDTMYSNPKFTTWDTRGATAAYVSFDAEKTEVRGTQLDGTRYEYTLRKDGKDPSPFQYIGEELQGDAAGFWVRAVTMNGEMLCSQQRGRRYIMKTCDVAYVQHHLSKIEEANTEEANTGILNVPGEEDARSFLEHEIEVSKE